MTTRATGRSCGPVRCHHVGFNPTTRNPYCPLHPLTTTTPPETLTQTTTTKTELKSFEKWLIRSGVWAAQPVLALLTTCGTAAPRGLRAGTGADGSGDAAARAASAGKELVGASEYPADETLAEMVDQYEALVCWFYLPDGGCCDGSSGSGSGDGGDDGGGGDGANEQGGGGGGGGRSYGQGIACFVAYHDEGERRAKEGDGSVDGGGGGGRGGKNSKRLADLEAKRAAIAARARGRRPQGEEGGEGGGYAGSQSSASSGDDSSDSGSDARGDEELDAEDFEPGALRVRVILATAGTTEQLRKAAGAFLKTTRNRNPVSGSGCND